MGLGVVEGNRVEAGKRTDFSCGLYHVIDGRCAGSVQSLQGAHIENRGGVWRKCPECNGTGARPGVNVIPSARVVPVDARCPGCVDSKVPGKVAVTDNDDEVEIVCADCHDRIDHRNNVAGRWLWRVERPDGRFAYSETKGGSPTVVLWTNDGETIEGLALAAHGVVLDCRSKLRSQWWRLAGALYDLHIGQKVTLLGLGISGHTRSPYEPLWQYVQSVDLGRFISSQKVLRQMVNAEAIRRQLPEDEAELAQTLAAKLFRDAGRILTELDPAQRREIYTIAQNVDATGAVEEARRVHAEKFPERVAPKPRVVVVEGTVRAIGISATVEIGDDGKTEAGDDPIDHVRNRLRQHRYITGFEGDTLRKSRPKLKDD